MSGTWGPGANDKTTCSLASSKHGGLPGIRLKSLYIEAHRSKPECSSEQDRVSVLFMCGCRGHKLSRLPFAIGGSSPKPPTLNERRLDSPSDGAWQSHIAERLGWGTVVQQPLGNTISHKEEDRGTKSRRPEGKPDHSSSSLTLEHLCLTLCTTPKALIGHVD